MSLSLYTRLFNWARLRRTHQPPRLVQRRADGFIYGVLR